MEPKIIKGKLSKVALLIEVDGEINYVVLPQDRLRMLVQMAGTLSDDGRLHLAKAKGMEFQS